ncbi:MAG TPA: restriction endonuclease subunit S [Alcaligenes faecalis]|nr:restriction endonuclease subunit S [Alcaligenes faecalis]
MSSEVTTHPLKSLCLLVVDCPHSTPLWTDSGVVVLRNQNIKDGRLDLTNPSFTDEAHYVGRVKRAVPQENDLVITREAPMGEVCLIPKGLKCCLGQRQVLLRPDPDKINSRYLLYALQSPYLQRQIGWNEGTGSTVSNLRIPVLEQLSVPTPLLKTQQEIALMLGALDDRITLLCETNKTLESIAQAIFKSWFVDFDPVRAKMEGRQPEGMDKETAALFPDSFEESEWGTVPKGWLPIRLDSFLELAYGKALKADNRNPGDVPVYGSGGITGWHDTALISSPSIIVGRKGTVGSLYWESRPFFPIDTVFYVKTEKPLTYCWQLLKTLRLQDMNTDAAVPGLNRENVYRLLVPNAPASLLDAFDATANVLRQSIDHNEEQALSLSTLRDTLLPRLISGQLRLPEAQEQAEDALP